jgi:hypothetical protein
VTIPNTSDFTLSAFDVIQHAMARAGGERVQGFELKFAKQQLQLMMKSWKTKGRGAFLWTENLLSEGNQIVLTANQNLITFPADCMDVLEVELFYPDTSVGIPMDRIGRTEWTMIPEKNAPGPPVQIYCHRDYNFSTGVWQVQGRLFPTADANTTYTVQYNYLRYFKDIVSYTDNIDVPDEYLEAVVCGLAYFVARNRVFRPNSNVTEQTITRLKAEYDEAFELALNFGIDRAPMMFRPNLSAYTGAN